MFIYTIKALSNNAGTNGKSIRDLLATINTKLQTDDVTLHCYRGGDVWNNGGVGGAADDGSLCLFSTVPGRRLIVNFVDPPLIRYKAWNTSGGGGIGPFGETIAGNLLATFGSFNNFMRFRVANVTLNNAILMAGGVTFEANTTGDVDPDATPLNNGGVANVTVVLNNCQGTAGGWQFICSDDGSTMDVTANNSTASDSDFQFSLAANAVMTARMYHCGSYNDDPGFGWKLSGAAGSTLNLVRRNSIVGGAAGFFKTSGVGSGTLHLDDDAVSLPGLGQNLSDIGYANSGGDFVIDASPAPDQRLKVGSPAIRAGIPGVINLDGAGKDRRLLGTSLGPIEPVYDYASGASGGAASRRGIGLG